MRNFNRIVLAIVLSFCPIVSQASGFGSSVSLESYRARSASVSVANLAATGSTTIVSVSGLGAGSLSAVSCRITTGVTGTPTITLDINADGKGIVSITVYSAAATWTNDFFPFQNEASTVGSATGGTAVGDAFIKPFSLRFATTLTVAVNVTVAAGAGAMACSVSYGTVN